MAAGLMMISSIIFIIFASLWTCHDAASDTLKPGDTLNSSSSLVSASGKFSLYFYVYNDGSNNNSYLAILNKEAPNNVWIDPIVISSAPQTSNISTSVVATLLDSGNFILQEVNSTDGSTKQVWWQSFDYPFDTFLPGMKLGINHKSGHLWSMSSWATYNNPMPGPFTLDWDPNGHQLQIRRQGVLYWTSGVFTSSSKTFEFISAEESKLRYNFSVVSNDKEDYFTYTAVDHDQSDQEPQWVLTFMGRFHDGSFNFTQADNCDGYNTGGGCVRRDRPSDCMAKFNDEFELKNGYFKINNSSNSSRSPSWFGTSSSDCKATCWQNCDCLGFDVPLANGTSTGCRFWSVDCQFFEDLTASNSFVLSGHATPAKSPSAKKNGHKWLWVGIAIAAAVLVVVFCIYLLRRRIVSGKNRANIQNKMLSFMKHSNRPTDEENMGQHDLNIFTYESVLAATCNFSQENKLGEGGFGPVYKGKLANGREIAVKRLSKCSGQGTSEFKNELILIHELQHRNLVQLFGFCIHEEERMLIYEYMPNKSLDYFLFDSIRGVLLDWKKRFNIIEGITQGLLYLHKYSRTRVIHRDLKASNILLDENMNPKISDFGMARIFSHDELEENTSRIVGTRGYMPPESVEGIVSVKFDVYSFGVLMLEIISGRKNNSFYNDDRALNLVGYAWELWKQGSGLELMDQMVGDSSCIEDQLLRCIHVGLLCVEEDAADRPTMSDVISMLTNENPPLALPTKPAFFVGRKLVEAGIGEKQHEITSVNDLSISNFDAR
ncbi:G-type lectin S-receptor-like serine/threonine-protein kinase CES101 [Prunus dulcis]|uniref:G-type lectin S-receptor-like serine/threonine-protein kinase CES101 n=1 Tax=Prunus dulcis TaxID=3755 RepID=UPI0014822A6E|nr:G-type lectin S-receptor-like serine/threonine-protein kinase CES101 [Prunus dulcis]